MYNNYHIYFLLLTVSRKKCDESFPQCTACIGRNEECNWNKHVIETKGKNLGINLENFTTKPVKPTGRGKIEKKSKKSPFKIKKIDIDSSNHLDTTSPTKSSFLANSQLIPLDIFATPEASFTYNTLARYLSTSTESITSPQFDLSEPHPTQRNINLDYNRDISKFNLHYDIFDIRSLSSFERNHKIEEVKDDANGSQLSLSSIKSNMSISDFFCNDNNEIEATYSPNLSPQPLIKNTPSVDENNDNNDNKESIYCETLSPQSLITNSPASLDDLLDDLLFTSFTIQPSSMIGRSLDETGKLFLQYYQIEVCRFITVGAQKSNYFLLTYLKMSDEPAISHSLAAFGGYYLSGSVVNPQVKYHLQQGNKLIRQFLKSRVTLSKQDYLMLLCFYSVQLGANVCSGDVSQWKIMFDNIKSIIQKFGGVRRLLQEFNYSNDIKFFLHSFGYHDIMSSDSTLTGTVFPVEEYRVIQEDGTSDYGVDPLHGCNHAIYLLLGELMNLKIEIKNYNEQMELYSLENNTEMYQHTKLLKLKLIDTKVSEINSQFAEAKPNDYLLNLTGDDSEMHLKIYDLYTIAAKMYCLTYIQQIPPTGHQIQMLLTEGLKLFEELVNTKMNIILCFPLLMLGISSVGSIDRMHIESMFTSLMPIPINNIGRSLTITREAWKRNPHGDLIIDWADICEDFGWSLSPV